MNEPKPSGPILLPVVGMLALFPGVVMYGFAMGEATRLASDWVYLSTPLLVIGAASFAWLLHGRLGLPGLVGGAVLSLGALVAAGITLQRTATERGRWQESSSALSRVTRFCRGDTKPDTRALPYVEGGTNPTVFNDGNTIYDDKLEPYEPARHQIEEAALIACVTDVRVPVETCNGYTGGGVAERERVDRSLKVFSIKTGDLVFEKKFEGKPPRACANTEQFYGKSLRVIITGDPPPKPDLVAELGPLLKR
jgi:hypothetical protein